MMNAKRSQNGMDDMVRQVIEREHEGMITIADVARVAGVDPKAARARLRQLIKEAKVKIPQSVEEGKWVYPKSKAGRLLKLIKKQ